MECREVQKLLSTYHDNELSAEVHSLVTEHVQSCPSCGAELATFQSLSEMASELKDPEPSEEIWTGIEARLDAGRESTRGRPAVLQGRFPRRWRLGVFTTAASVMIAIGLGWLVTRSWHPSAHHIGLAADFEDYFEHFAENPATAQNVLLAKYEGGAVDLVQATRHLGYKPAVAVGLPKRYSLVAMYVLKMPCCTCVQSICRRDDGRVFAIFEHDEEQQIGLGDRPRVETQCKGCPCSVVQADRGLVASWKADKRQFTVVGARDLEDVSDLITHFQNTPPGV